jgi:hypothetical protein
MEREERLSERAGTEVPERGERSMVPPAWRKPAGKSFRSGDGKRAPGTDLECGSLGARFPAICLEEPQDLPADGQAEARRRYAASARIGAVNSKTFSSPPGDPIPVSHVDANESRSSAAADAPRRLEDDASTIPVVEDRLRTLSRRD